MIEERVTVLMEDIVVRGRAHWRTYTRRVFDTTTPANRPFKEQHTQRVLALRIGTASFVVVEYTHGAPHWKHVTIIETALPEEAVQRFNERMNKLAAMYPR